MIVTVYNIKVDGHKIGRTEIPFGSDEDMFAHHKKKISEVLFIGEKHITFQPVKTITRQGGSCVSFFDERAEAFN